MKNYEKPMVISETNSNKEQKLNQKPLYLADGRWCCKVKGHNC